MPSRTLAATLLEQETRAMLTRLDRLRPFALHETMLPAAAPLPAAQVAIERFLGAGRRELRQRLHGYLRWLDGDGRNASPARAQHRFAGLRWRFNDLLSQFDVFDDAITQRSEHETGVWLSGLDVAAVDALSLPTRYFDPPPVICYLDRGPGGAIRRARTRLPGGGRNPVAIIRIPRERMIGHGIAASLVHEVGHQAAALLGLVRSVRVALRPLTTGRGTRERVAWSLWSRWISEILADFWAVGKLGIAGTLGLMSVVSLPRWFVFRVNPNDPHPVPWIRVQASASLGALLHPDRQWSGLTELWRSYYPVAGSAAEVREIVSALLDTLPELAALLVEHRPDTLRGATLASLMPAGERSPGPLLRAFDTWAARPALLREASPTLAFAVLGQARVAGRLSPEAESRVLGDLLTQWALDSTLAVARRCAPYLTTTSRRQRHDRHATLRRAAPALG